MRMAGRGTQDINALLDWSLDWKSFLTEGDSLDTMSVEIVSPSGDPSPMVISNTPSPPTISGTLTIAYVEGGTKDKEYQVIHSIVTTTGRKERAAIIIKVLA